LFIIDDIIAIYSVLKTAWTAFKAIKVVASALEIAGKVIKILSVIKFLGSLQKPKLPSAGSELELQIDPNAGLPIAVGERLTYGNLAFRKTWTGGKNNAEPNQILGTVKVMSSGGPIESIEYCQLGDNKVTSFAGNPLTSLVSVTGCSPATGKVYTYEGHYHQRWSKGDLTGSVPSLAYFNAGGWTGYDSSSSLTGFAWVAEVLKKNDTTFPQGLPSAGYLIKGLKWYDPRKDSTVSGGSGSHRWNDPDTYEYSRNAFIVTYNYIRGRLEKTAGGLVVKSWGLHVNPALIDLDSFIEAANIADALGWNVNAIGNTTDTPKAFIDKLLQCSGGYLISQAAKITAFINAPKTAVYNITDEDIIGEISIDTSTSYRDRINSVIPVYPEPALGYEDYYAEAITVQKYQDEDGELKETELQLDYCTDIDQATQLAALELVNSREFLSYTALCKPRTMAIKTGQTVTITSVGLNTATQKCLVVGRELDLGSMTVKLKLRSEDDAKYDWIQGLSPTAPDTKAIVGLEWANPSAPDADVYTVASFVDADQIPAFLISGNVGDIPDAVSVIRFDYKLSSASDWTTSGSVVVNDYDNISYAIRGLKPVTYYDIAISYVNSFGVVTDRTIFTNKITSKLISNDTQNVGGVNAGDLVNTATQAYSLGWDAVNNAAIFAAQVTSNFASVANALTLEASNRANAVAALSSSFTATANSLQANIDALASQIDEASLAPAWSNAITYTIGDIVTNNGSLWKAIANGVNHQPPSSYWVLIGHYDSISGAVDGLATQVTLTNANVTTLNNTVAATASTVTGISARLSNAETKANTAALAITALQTNATLTANTVASQANAITAVQSNVTALQSTSASQSSALSALQANSLSQGNLISSQALSITALNSNIASLVAANTVQATAITGLQTLTTQQGSNIASQAASITSLNSNITALNASNAVQSSAISALQTLTTNQGANIASQASDITSLESSLLDAGSENLVYNPSFEIGSGPVADGWGSAKSAAVTASWDMAAGASASGIAQRIVFSGLTSSLLADVNTQTAFRPLVDAGTTYTFSVYAVATAGVQLVAYVQYIDSGGAVLGTYNSGIVAASGSWQRLMLTASAPSGSKTAHITLRTSGGTSVTSGVVYWDRAQLEKGTSANGWHDNILATSTAVSDLQTLTTSQGGLISASSNAITALTSNIAALNAANAVQSTAISALQTLTTTQGSSLSTQAASITSLQSQINDSGGDNLVYNPSFESGTATVAAEGWSVAGTYTSAVVQNLISYDGNQGKSQRLNVTGLTTSVYADVKTATGVEAQVTAGKAYTLSAYVNATNNIFQHRMYIQFRDSGGSVLSTPTSALFTSTGTWTRLTLAGTAPAGAVDAVVYLRTFGATTTASVAGNIFWDMVQLEVGSATAFRDNIRASTLAISGLQTSVTQTNGTVTATATSLSTLSTTVGGHTASISSLNTTTNGLSARASLTVSAGGAVTGFSLTSNAAAGSTFAIQADKFILTSGTKSVSPFSVDVTNSVVTCTNLIVDTLQIKKGATSQYGYFQDATAYVVTGSTSVETTFASVTITSTGGFIDIMGTLSGRYNNTSVGSGAVVYEFRLYRGSTLLCAVPGVYFGAQSGAPSQGASGVFVDEPAAGTYTYSMRGIVTSSITSTSTYVTYRSLRVIEFKR
jgi:uncharacterized coiled-coil protein SlyX